MSSTTASYLDLKDELIAGFPAGIEDAIDWDDPLGPGPLMEACGHLLEDCGTAQVDALRLELSPLTCSPAALSVWEQSLALSQSKMALTGTTAQRRAQVIARLREFGPPTRWLIQSVLNAFLCYADQSQIVILESNRALVRAANQVSHLYGSALGLGTSATVITFTVRDDPRVSKGGAQVDLSLTVSDLSTLIVTLTGPDSFSIEVPVVGRGPTLTAWLATPQSWITRGLWVQGSSAVYAAGDGGAVKLWNGSIWLDISNLSVTSTLRCVVGITTMALAIWTVGDGGLAQYTTDDVTWHVTATGVTSTLYGIWGSSTATWTAGAAGVVLFYNGTTWSAPQATGTGADLLSIWGSGNSDIWAVGQSGTILHYTGAAWASVSSPTTSTLRAVFGTSSSDAWAVGDGGTILHWDGTSWTVQPSSTTDDLYAVWASSTSSVWASGAGGTILFWNGTSWARQVSNTLLPLYAVQGSSGTSVWAGGPEVITTLAPGNGAPNLRLYFPQFIGRTAIYGTWTLTIGLSTGTGSLSAATLLVEGLGRYYDFAHAPQDGLGAAMYQWGVVAEDAKLGAGYDLDGALAAIRRLSYARSLGTLVRRSSGPGALPPGQFAAIPDDPGTIPDECIPG